MNETSLKSLDLMLFSIGCMVSSSQDGHFWALITILPTLGISAHLCGSLGLPYIPPFFLKSGDGCSVARSYLTLCDPMDSIACQASLSFTISLSLLKLVSIESMMPFNHLILCPPLILLPSTFPTSGSFPMSWLFTSGGQSIGASAPASVLPMNIQGWFKSGINILYF